MQAQRTRRGNAFVLLIERQAGSLSEARKRFSLRSKLTSMSHFRLTISGLESQIASLDANCVVL